MKCPVLTGLFLTGHCGSSSYLKSLIGYSEEAQIFAPSHTSSVDIKELRQQLDASVEKAAKNIETQRQAKKDDEHEYIFCCDDGARTGVRGN